MSNKFFYNTKNFFGVSINFALKQYYPIHYIFFVIHQAGTVVIEIKTFFFWQKQVDFTFFYNLQHNVVNVMLFDCISAGFRRTVVDYFRNKYIKDCASYYLSVAN